MIRLKQLKSWFSECMHFTLKCTKQLISIQMCWYLENWWGRNYEMRTFYTCQVEMHDRKTLTRYGNSLVGLLFDYCSFSIDLVSALYCFKDISAQWLKDVLDRSMFWGAGHWRLECRSRKPVVAKMNSSNWRKYLEMTFLS